MDHHHTRLTSAEIASLWGQYINDTMGLCMNTIMLQHIEDLEIRSVFEHAIQLGKEHRKKITDFFTKENFPIPIGFTKEDVFEAPRLFSDIFCLHYLHEMTIHGLTGYAVSLSSSTRMDIRQYYQECNIETMQLYNQTTDILLSKGKYSRPPNISTPEGVDFIKSQNFITGWLGERRPLNVIEISSISFNLTKSILAKAILIAFSQVAQSKDVRHFLVKGINIANKHIQENSAKLHEDNLPSPQAWESEVTNSTMSPISDKLIMYHSGFLFQVALAYYGAAMAVSTRADLIAQYSKIITEDFVISKDWMDIMIKHGWLEQPPQADDRAALAKDKK